MAEKHRKAYTMPCQCVAEKHRNGKYIYMWYEWKSYSEIRKMYGGNWYLMIEGRPCEIIEGQHFYHVQVGIN